MENTKSNKEESAISIGQPIEYSIMYELACLGLIYKENEDANRQTAGRIYSSMLTLCRQLVDIDNGQMNRSVRSVSVGGPGNPSSPELMPSELWERMLFHITGEWVNGKRWSQDNCHLKDLLDRIAEWRKINDKTST